MPPISPGIFWTLQIIFDRASNNLAITEHQGYPGKITPSKLTVIENFLSYYYFLSSIFQFTVKAVASS